MKQMVQIGESNWISLEGVQFISYFEEDVNYSIKENALRLEIQYETGKTVSLQGKAAKEGYSRLKPILVARLPVREQIQAAKENK